MKKLYFSGIKHKDKFTLVDDEDFDNKIEAAKIYNQYAKIYFNEFACLNII